ncbi:MAG: thiamine pyrophosphate-dependent enzyme [Bacteroidetes bacterium]|nr:thiamine pyrophosphate-dependent enzyme [Bacteroidota bacterium]MCL5737837.1 thiamine pyrophosphate-dependent enzyme [Bacteroidota bacterium]
MSEALIQNTENPKTFLKVDAKFPFCKGCGHHHITQAINDALVKLQLEPSHVNITSDIGCVGLVDALFDSVHSFHTTHGRSTAFATGVEIADSILADSKLKNIVVIGDGGAMIGLLHLVNAAQLNVDVTVVLYNNFLFGMTGGQNSSFSPVDFITTTTPRGNIIPPIDIITLLEGANAGYLARKTATDSDLADTIAEAIAYPGFALVEILELCTEYALRGNSIRGNKLAEVAPGKVMELGVIANKKDRVDFGDAYKTKFPGRETTKGTKSSGIVPKYENSLKKKVGFVIAGTAGERVQFSAYTLVETAVLAGANATQKNDNPVTQGTGFSLSEVVISRDEIFYTGIDTPDVVVVVSEDGVMEMKSQGVFRRANESTLIIADESLEIPECAGKIMRLPLRKKYSPSGAAFAGILTAVKATGILPLEAFREIVPTIVGTGRQKKSESYLSIINEVEHNN